MCRMFIIFLILLFVSNLALAEDCTPTPHRSTGNHYKPVTVEKINMGKGVMVRGQILSAPDCIPVPDAKIARWQGGEEGRYKDELYAYMYADENGKYEYETEWPNMPTPHIHFIVTADGFKPLETQWRGNGCQTVIEFDLVIESSN